jgi:hypothetical protein
MAGRDRNSVRFAEAYRRRLSFYQNRPVSSIWHVSMVAASCVKKVVRKAVKRLTTSRYSPTSGNHGATSVCEDVTLFASIKLPHISDSPDPKILVVSARHEDTKRKPQNVVTLRPLSRANTAKRSMQTHSAVQVPLEPYIRQAYGHVTDTIFARRPDHQPPMLRRDRVNRILLYPGAFNPPHQGHMTLVHSAMLNTGADWNFIATLILPRDGDFVEGKRKPGICTHEETTRATLGG